MQGHTWQESVRRAGWTEVLDRVGGTATHSDPARTSLHSRPPFFHPGLLLDDEAVYRDQPHDSVQSGEGQTEDLEDHQLSSQARVKWTLVTSGVIPDHFSTWSPFKHLLLEGLQVKVSILLHDLLW
jgi:hypothetical protein